MKKTYIAPDVLIVDIETQFVIADSPAVGLSLLDSTDDEDAFAVGGSRSNLWGED